MKYGQPVPADVEATMDAFERRYMINDPGDENDRADQWDTVYKSAGKIPAALAERANEPCKTYDAGKPPLSWLPRAPLEAMARVLDQATGPVDTARYARHNWRKGMSWSRHLDSALRHLLAYCDGVDLDPETGQNHLAHALVRLSFVLEYQAKGLGTDDRHTVGGEP